MQIFTADSLVLIMNTESHSGIANFGNKDLQTAAE